MFIVLNAANYESPACGPDGYFGRYLKLLRFWVIPFGAFSIFMACHSAESECVFLFPTDLRLLTAFIGMMAFILVSGLSIHYIILPKFIILEHRGSIYLVREQDQESLHLERALTEPVQLSY